MAGHGSIPHNRGMETRPQSQKPKVSLRKKWNFHKTEKSPRPKTGGIRKSGFSPGKILQYLSPKKMIGELRNLLPGRVNTSDKSQKAAMKNIDSITKHGKNCLPEVPEVIETAKLVEVETAKLVEVETAKLVEVETAKLANEELRHAEVKKEFEELIEGTNCNSDNLKKVKEELKIAIDHYFLPNFEKKYLPEVLITIQAALQSIPLKPDENIKGEVSQLLHLAISFNHYLITEKQVLSEKNDAIEKLLVYIDFNSKTYESILHEETKKLEFEIGQEYKRAKPEEPKGVVSTSEQTISDHIYLPMSPEITPGPPNTPERADRPPSPLGGRRVVHDNKAEDKVLQDVVWDHLWRMGSADGTAQPLASRVDKIPTLEEMDQEVLKNVRELKAKIRSGESLSQDEKKTIDVLLQKVDLDPDTAHEFIVASSSFTVPVRAGTYVVAETYNERQKKFRAAISKQTPGKSPNVEKFLKDQKNLKVFEEKINQLGGLKPKEVETSEDVGASSTGTETGKVVVGQENKAGPPPPPPRPVASAPKSPTDTQANQPEQIEKSQGGVAPEDDVSESTPLTDMAPPPPPPLRTDAHGNLVDGSGKILEKAERQKTTILDQIKQPPKLRPVSDKQSASKIDESQKKEQAEKDLKGLKAKLYLKNEEIRKQQVFGNFTVLDAGPGSKATKMSIKDLEAKTVEDAEKEVDVLKKGIKGDRMHTTKEIILNQFKSYLSEKVELETLNKEKAGLEKQIATIVNDLKAPQEKSVAKILASKVEEQGEEVSGGEVPEDDADWEDEDKELEKLTVDNLKRREAADAEKENVENQSSPSKVKTNELPKQTTKTPIEKSSVDTDAQAKIQSRRESMEDDTPEN